MERWIKIFAEGRHDDVNRSTWTKKDVEKLFELNIGRRLPLVPGHPEDDLPIIGWINGLRKVLENGRLYIEGRIEKIDDEFKRLLKNVGMDKVSVSIRGDGLIKHVGLVESPAVAGLGMAFSKIKNEKGETNMEEVLQKLAEIEARLATLEAKISEWESNGEDVPVGVEEALHQKVALSKKCLKLFSEALSSKDAEKLAEAIKEYRGEVGAYSSANVFSNRDSKFRAKERVKEILSN